MIKVLKSVVVGPLEPYTAGFAAELERQGYTSAVAEKQVGVAAHLRDSAISPNLHGLGGG